MVIAYRQFAISNASQDQVLEMQQVGAIADGMREEMTRVSDAIDLIHQWRAKSHDIQATFSPG